MAEPSYNYSYTPTVDHRESNLYREEYYSSTDTKIYFDDENQTEISFIQYELQEQLKPVYGYNSRTFDDVVIGNRIVTGQFAIPIKNKEKQVFSIDEYTEKKINNNGIDEYNNQEDYNLESLDWFGYTQKYDDKGYKLNSKKSVVRIMDITDGDRYSLYYDASNPEKNYRGSAIGEIKSLMGRTGLVDTSKVSNNEVDIHFRNAIMNYQKAAGLTVNGILDDTVLQDMHNRALNNNPTEINDDNQSEYDEKGYKLNNDNIEYINAHYDPFFLNNSSKIYRKNHKDIVIAFGDESSYKLIKDVFMRSVGVQVDTSGKPISESYSFIARDIVESDAEEDFKKYIGEEEVLSASSDIKYNFSSLYKNP